jgi:beta-lactamase class A
MTLVMDGVKRSGTIRSTLPLVSPRQAAREAALARMNAAAVVPTRTVVGMDGIRRSVAMPTPLEVLGNLHAPIPVTDVPTDDGAVEASAPAPARPWRQRPVVAFGLVASAVVAMTATSMIVNNHRTTAVEADTAVATVAPTPTATPAAVLALAKQNAELQNVLNQFTAAHPGQFNIVVKDLKTGALATVDPDRSYLSASLYKLFVADRIYGQIDTGKLSYGNAAGGGTGRTIEGCLNIMITISDNGCGRALGSILGWGSQNAELKNAGFTGTNLATPQQTSARDVALLFERLYQGTLNSPNSNSAFMQLLKSQRVNNRLPQGLPAGVTIAHKTGDLDGVMHDAGIVYGPKTDYLVVVMSGPWQSPGNAPAQFADLSRQLWTFFQQ